MRIRRIGASVLVVLASVLLLLSSVGWWAKRYFLDSERFSDKATQIVERTEVQQALSVAITDQITKKSGRDVQFAEPVITSIVEKVVQSSAFQDVFDAAVLRLHRAVVGGGARNAVLDLSETVDRVKTALEPIAPNLADDIPSGKQVRVTVLDRSQLRTVYDTTNLVKKIVLLLTIVTVVCFAAGLALSPRRWRTLALAGWVTLGLFALSLVLVRAGRSVTGSFPKRAEYSDAAEAAYKVITRGLLVQGIVIAILASLVALGAGWTDRHGGWAAVTAALSRGTAWVREQLPKRSTAPEPAFAGAPATTAVTVGGALAPRLPPPAHRARTAHWWRAAALLVLGVFAILSPGSLTTIVVVLLGIVALYLAVTEAVAAWGTPKEPRVGVAPDLPSDA